MNIRINNIIKPAAVFPVFICILFCITISHAVLSCADIRSANGTSTAPALKRTNFISSTFEILDNNGFPCGWTITENKDKPRRFHVTIERGDKKELNVVKVDINEESSVHIDTMHCAELDLQNESLLIVQCKIQNMHYIGNWYNRPAGVWIYAYGFKDKHRWMAVRGEGSTDGWVTAVMPFPAKKDKKDGRDLSRPKVLLRCYNMAGVVYFRNPMILEKPTGVDSTHFFEMENGRQVFGNVLTLTDNLKGR